MGTDPRLLERLHRPVDGASVAAFRAIFGATMLVAVVRYFAHGWIDAQFVEPRMFFPYEGLEWVRPWSRAGMYVHFAALGALALGIAAGRGALARIAAALFALGFTYLHLIDKTNYLNHYYLVSLLSLLLAAVPASPRVPAWAVAILRFQVGLVYFFGGIAKLDPDWLIDAQPLRIWLARASDLPLAGPLLETPAAAVAMSWAGAAFDLAAPFALLSRRARPFALGAHVAFHLATAALFPIGLFPYIMLGAATIFLEPDWPRRLRLPVPPPGPDPAAPSPRARLATAAALALFAAVQALAPLRSLARPGDVLWTEDGFRFSWRVMLVEKAGWARFEARDPATGARETIDPLSVLTPVQARMMATQPDMVLAFAHRIRDERARAGKPGMEVYADVRVSLNGRPGRPLVDPAMDLARIPRGAAPHTFAAPSPRRSPGLGRSTVGDCGSSPVTPPSGTRRALA